MIFQDDKLGVHRIDGNFFIQGFGRDIIELATDETSVNLLEFEISSDESFNRDNVLEEIYNLIKLDCEFISIPQIIDHLRSLDGVQTCGVGYDKNGNKVDLRENA